MGFLKNFNRDINQGIHENWTSLETEDQLRKAIEDSKDKPVGFFKHSTRCGISSRAKYVLEDDWDLAKDEIDFYYIDLLKFRPISNLVAELTQVIHQSPQIIIMKDGDVVLDASHHDITVAEIKEVIE